MEMNDISAAIRALSPGAKFTLRGTNLESDLEWFEGDRPTDEDILAKAAEIIAEQSIDWAGLLTDFLEPGNALYESCLAKSLAAGNLAYHRFSNLQQVISNPSLRSPGAIAFGIGQLNGALTGENGLSNTEKIAWNDLMDAHAFPTYCKLPV